MLVEKNTYRIILEDNKVWRKDLLTMYLYDCANQDRTAVIDSFLEGSCCDANGLYRLLDAFCERTGYDPGKITIRTANLVEHHDRYNIIRVPQYWYEVDKINKWLEGKHINNGTNPGYHFGNFIGRANWSRLWIASLLASKFADSTLQTFNSGMRSHYVIKEHTCDYLGLEDLVKHECDILPQVIEFLQTCPRVIPDDIEFIKTVKSFIPQPGYYPIQHPANLNILKEYHKIFVDIVCETRVTGNCFFVTEKTWRCIIARRPFIVMGSQYFLQNLKRLGFKTFDQYWDEGYDEYAPKDRVKHIETVLETISTWPVDVLHQKLELMQSILDHNYQVFTNLNYQKIKQVFCNNN